MKGQLSIEYYISLILFVFFIVYLSFQIVKITPTYIRELKNENLRIEAYQLSELLINDPGEPINWDSQPQVKRIGLSSNENKTNLLSGNKIAAMKTKCSTNYEDVRRLIGTEYYFSLFLTNETLRQTICQPTNFPVRETNTTITRVVAIDDNSIGNLSLFVW
ncbi:MAG: hypothetical protein QXO27_03840 [Candidatus Aenigmatarchaeota archaeon]